VDPKNIKSIEEWSTPRNITVVSSFMGLACYYRMFIEGISKITHPITSLQKSFQHMKSLLTSVPILRIVDSNVEFVVCMDACKEGLYGFLSHNGHVVCYKS
jgi:hypothetical protein